MNKGKKKVTTSRIVLKNKASVISRPVGNTGDAVRGFTGNVLYIDEAAGMPEIMWKAAMPTLATTGGQIWMSSTPRGKFINNTTNKNFFFTRWEHNEERRKVITTNPEEIYKNREVNDDCTQKKKTKSAKPSERAKC